MSNKKMMTTPIGEVVSASIRYGFLLLALMISCLSVSAAWAEGDETAGGQKAYSCLGCHGVKHYVNVYPTYHVPKIAGQHQVYLISALKAYRAGERQHQTMQANASSLSDQDIEDIAAYFANLNK